MLAASSAMASSSVAAAPRRRATAPLRDEPAQRRVDVADEQRRRAIGANGFRRRRARRDHTGPRQPEADEARVRADLRDRAAVTIGGPARRRNVRRELLGLVQVMVVRSTVLPSAAKPWIASQTARLASRSSPVVGSSRTTAADRRRRRAQPRAAAAGRPRGRRPGAARARRGRSGAGAPPRAADPDSARRTSSTSSPNAQRRRERRAWARRRPPPRRHWARIAAERCAPSPRPAGGAQQHASAVDFPAPFGPRARTRRRARRSATAPQRHDRAEALVTSTARMRAGSHGPARGGADDASRTL